MAIIPSIMEMLANEPSQPLGRWQINIIPIVQLGKLGHRKGLGLAQAHRKSAAELETRNQLVLVSSHFSPLGPEPQSYSGA